MRCCRRTLNAERSNTVELCKGSLSSNQPRVQAQSAYALQNVLGRTCQECNPCGSSARRQVGVRLARRRSARWTPRSLSSVRACFPVTRRASTCQTALVPSLSRSISGLSPTLLRALRPITGLRGASVPRNYPYNRWVTRPAHRIEYACNDKLVATVARSVSELSSSAIPDSPQ